MLDQLLNDLLKNAPQEVRDKFERENAEEKGLDEAIKTLKAITDKHYEKCKCGDSFKTMIVIRTARAVGITAQSLHDMVGKYLENEKKSSKPRKTNEEIQEIANKAMREALAKEGITNVELTTICRKI
jgi:hypothetical protein